MKFPEKIRIDSQNVLGFHRLVTAGDAVYGRPCDYCGSHGVAAVFFKTWTEGLIRPFSVNIVRQVCNACAARMKV